MRVQSTCLPGGRTVSGWEVMPPDLATRPAGCYGDARDVLAEEDQSPDAVVMFDVRAQRSGVDGDAVVIAVSRLAHLVGVPDEELCKGCRGTGICVDAVDELTGPGETLYSCYCMLP